MTVRHGSSKTPRDTSTDQQPGEDFLQHKARLVAMARDLGAEVGSNWSRQALIAAIGRASGPKRKPRAKSTAQRTSEWNLAHRTGRIVDGRIIPEGQELPLPKIATMSECTQEIGCRCPGCTEARHEIKGRVDHDAALAAEFKASIPELPGQDVFGGRTYTDPTDGSVYLQKDDDLLVCSPITTVSQVDSKIRAEGNDHPKSIDWQAAPAGTKELYAALCDITRQALQAGRDTLVPVDMGKVAGKIAWLTKGNGAPLLVIEQNRFVRLLRDPRSTRKSNPYPGCPEGVNPKAGRSWGERLDMALAWVRSTPWGAKLTGRDVCRVLNSPAFRDLFGVQEYRHVSETNLSNATVRARKAGTVRMVQPAVQYRQNHMWHLESAAVYRTSLKLMPSQVAQVEACIRAALQAKADEVRERLEAA